MHLTLQALKAITKGCLAIHETPEGFRFQRMTDKQLAAVDHIERYHLRSRFPAGVRFDFRTDAAALSLSYEILGFDPNRNFFGLDLYVDGVLVGDYVERPIATTRGVFRHELGKAGVLRRITLYLPISVIFALSDFTLEGASLLERADDLGGVLLCYGDSITQGYDALHPSLSYAATLARGLGLELLNQGISGYVFDPATVDAGPVPVPEAVTVAYGTNDWTNKETLAEIRSDMDRYLDRLVRDFPQSKLYVILPIWRGDCRERTAAGSFPEVVEALNASARRHPRIRVLDGSRAVPHCADFFLDGLLHPNDTGMQLYAQWLLAQISGDFRSNL